MLFKMKLLVVFGVVLLACVALGGEVEVPEDVETRVVGGQNAQRGEFPYIISLIYCLLGIICQHLCGGSILTPNRVLTAAHCSTEAPLIGTFSVRGGILLQNDPASMGQQISVSSIIIHPNYAGGVNPNDIAIAFLQGSFNFANPAIGPIALPAFQAGTTGVASLIGWGSTSTTNQPIMPNNLQVIPAKQVLSFAQCQEDLIFLFGTSNPLATSNVCTGGQGHSACSGDSGGPLLQGNTQVGVVSWGVIPCGTNRAPSVFVQVSNFTVWINSLL